MQVSERVKQTDEPVIVKTKRLMAAAAGTKVVSLAQGRCCCCLSFVEDTVTPVAALAGP